MSDRTWLELTAAEARRLTDKSLGDIPEAMDAVHDRIRKRASKGRCSITIDGAPSPKTDSIVSHLRNEGFQVVFEAQNGKYTVSW